MMKKTIAIVLTCAAAACFSMTVKERVAIAAEDVSKTAEVMPLKPEDREQFKAELLDALSRMPASPAERAEKTNAVSKVFAEAEAKEKCKVVVFPSAAPAVFTGKIYLDLTSSQTNTASQTNLLWLLEEDDMGYGLDRKPRTMDKSKKYYPGWRRGESIDYEPGGYPCQTFH